MGITRQDVERMARLARLELTESESEQLRGQLESIVGYVAELSSVDTDDVLPDTPQMQAGAAIREDRVLPGLTTEAALDQAPERADDSFCVPAFVDEG